MNEPAKFTIDTHAKKLAGPYYGPREIGESFNNIAGDLYLVVTPEQAAAFEHVVNRQGREKLENIGLEFGRNPSLLVKFTHILIGIESDGYAHS